MVTADSGNVAGGGSPVIHKGGPVGIQQRIAGWQVDEFLQNPFCKSCGRGNLSAEELVWIAEIGTAGDGEQPYGKDGEGDENFHQGEAPSI